jgi:hypothetical protein
MFGKVPQAAGCRPALVAAAAAAGGEGVPAGAPAGWELATRVSGDALAMMGEGDVAAAELILKKGGCSTASLATLSGQPAQRASLR